MPTPWPVTIPAVLRLLAFALCCLPAGHLLAADWPPRWHLADGWVLAPSASVQYQSLHADVGNAEGFRRQRVALTLTSAQGYSFKLDYDFAAGTWADVLMQVPLGERQRLRIGQVKTPVGLEVVGSHRDLALFERAALSTLLPGRRLGLEWSRRGGPMQLTVTAIGDNLDDQARGEGLFARGTGHVGETPAGGLLHLGVAAGVEWPDGNLRLRGRPDMTGLPLVIADSGLLANVARIDRVALEAAWDHGPWTLQAEYARLRAERDPATGAVAAHPNGDIDGDGAYLMAAWRPGGESRGYRDGLFSAPQAAAAYGAFELVARVSYLSVDTVGGGRDSGHSASFGGNWYLNRHWRVQAQVAGSPDDGAGRIYGLRLHHLF